MVGRGLTVYRSCGTSLGELRAAEELMAGGRIRVQPILSGVYPLSRINEGFAAAMRSQMVVIDA